MAIPYNAADMRRMPPLNDPKELALALGLRGRRGSMGIDVCCPAHDDRDPSCSIFTGEDGTVGVKCHACGFSGDALTLIGKVRGLERFEDIAEEASRLTGVMPTERGSGTRRIVATYDYRDRSGALLYQVVRYDPKAFMQRRPGSGPDEWIWKLGELSRVPYRLPELVAGDPAAPVVIVEGEKDADALAELGFVATTNAGGAGKWHYIKDLTPFVNRIVVVIADKDAPGRDHATKVVESLRGIARSTTIVEVPSGKDASDWISSGATASDVLRLLQTGEAESLFMSPAVSGVELARPLPPVEYFVSRLGMPCGPGAPHLFGGFGFSGKTVAHQMMNLALASARAIWKALTNGREQPWKITHVDGEQGLALTQRRYQRGARAMGEPLEQIGDRLCVRSYPKLRNGKSLKLVAENRNAWIELMTDRDLLMVDSFDAMRGSDTKQIEAEVRAGLDLLAECSEQTKCRGSVIHHANKASIDSRYESDPRAALAGNQGIFAACDSVYLLAGEKGDAVRVSQIKSRSHGEPVDDLALVISDVEADDDPKWGLAVHVEGVELIDEQKERRASQKQQQQLAKHMAKIRTLLSNGRRIARADLLTLSGLNPRDFSRALTELRERTKEVTFDKQKEGRGVSHLYYLVLEGGL